MSYVGLRAFHAVAAQGSFTAAASALGVSQPTVSGQVKALETRFGVTLFERRGRRVELSDLGRSLHGATTRMFAAQDESEQILATARELAGGRLRVGADSPFFVVPLLGAFKRLHPGIQISVSLGNSEALLEDLVARRADVAIVPGLEADPRWHSVALHGDRIVAVVPRGHRWARRRVLEPREVVEDVVILREQGSRTRAAFEAAIAGERLIPREVLEIGSREGVREAAAAGLGIGIIAEREVGSDPRLHAVPIRHEALAVVEHAACVAERRNVRVVAAFFELIDATRTVAG